MKKWAVFLGGLSGLVLISCICWVLWSVVLGTVRGDTELPTVMTVTFCSAAGVFVLALGALCFDEWWEHR